jgi:hypothetical protein
MRHGLAIWGVPLPTPCEITSALSNFGNCGSLGTIRERCLFTLGPILIAAFSKAVPARSGRGTTAGHRTNKKGRLEEPALAI